MPRNKDLKRLVRTRMSKTGEAYTTARAQIMRKARATTRTAAPSTSATPTTPSATPPASVRARTVAAKSDYAKLGGMSDAILKEKTGCTWERWVKALDYHGAGTMAHREIAELIKTKYKVGPWWGQMVAVGYERIKGLRARGQGRDGSYQAGKSRTYNVPVATLFDAWANASVRRRWLTGVNVKVRTSTAPKSIRLGWDDGSIIAVGFTAKGASKSTVAVEHSKVPDKETATRLKEFWSERLDALGEVLTER